MEKTKTFSVELTEFQAQLIAWVMRSDQAQERAFDLIDDELPDDKDTAGLTRDEYIWALIDRLKEGIVSIETALRNAQMDMQSMELNQ